MYIYIRMYIPNSSFVDNVLPLDKKGWFLKWGIRASPKPCVSTQNGLMTWMIWGYPSLGNLH